MGHEFRSEPTDIGNPQEWLELYNQQAMLEGELRSAGNALNEIIPQVAEFRALSQYAKDFGDDAGQLSIASDAAAFVEEKMPLIQQMAVLRQEARELATHVRRKEWELGVELGHIDPDEYVIRAIGPEHAAITHWTQARAEIEIYRNLTGVTRKDQTLGPGDGAPWSGSTLAADTWNIQGIQLGQIMLNENPEQVARQFGKEELLEQLGPPPPHTADEVMAIIDNPSREPWYEKARAACAKIEPPPFGLIIDRDWQ